jgi:hypothetical protein
MAHASKLQEVADGMSALGQKRKFARSFSLAEPVTRCGFAASFVQRVMGFPVLCFSVRHGESVVSQRVFPYITAIGIGIAAASALSFLSLAVASGIRFGLMH